MLSKQYLLAILYKIEFETIYKNIVFLRQKSL